MIPRPRRVVYRTRSRVVRGGMRRRRRDDRTRYKSSQNFSPGRGYGHTGIQHRVIYMYMERVLLYCLPAWEDVSRANTIAAARYL